MFQRTLRAAAVLVAVFGLGSSVRAETVQLRSGDVLDGDVSLEGAETVLVEARFPDVKSVRLKRDDLTPESLFAVLERRTDPKDVAKRRELGEIAEKLGLLGAAVSQYRAAAALDPTVAKDLESRIANVFELIAEDLLDDAKDLLDEGRPHAAIRYLHTILERYPKTEAAKGVPALMGKAHEAAGAASDVAKATVDAATGAKVADQVETHLGKGDKARAGVAGHEGKDGAGDQRAIVRAVDHYEDAWAQAKRFPVTETGNAELDKRLRALHARAKASLVQAYLNAGAVLLQRRAIPSAERYCNKACELDPENKTSHELHRWIVLAKITYTVRPGLGRGRMSPQGSGLGR